MSSREPLSCRRRFALRLALLRLVTAIAALCGASPVLAEDGAWRPLEVVRYAQPGGPTFVLTVEDDPSSGDTPRLRISRSGVADFVVLPPGGLVSTAEGLIDMDRPPPNLVRSKFVYLTKALRDRSGHPFLIVFGHGYASDPYSIRILRLAPSGAPKYALSEDQFEVEEILDLDHKGIGLAGRRTLSEVVGDCRKTYDPYAVLRLSPSTQTFVYSPRLSRSYTLKRLGRWAGPKARDDVTVPSACP